MAVLLVIAVVLIGALICLRLYMNGGVCRCTGRLDGKTVIVTGGNTGIGKVTAQVLAGRGARVILACRNVEAGQRAVDDIRKSGEPGIAGAELDVRELDLADFDSVHRFSRAICDTEQHLDILINNAGVMRCPKSQTRQGFETQYGVNHLGHFLLTNLLLPLMKISGSNDDPSRVITVSSLGHIRGEINFDDLNGDVAFNTRKAYSNSKLMNVLFTRELGQRLTGSSVVTCCLHPGIVRTELGRHMQKDFGAFYWAFVVIPFALLICKSPTQGAQTTIHTALKPDLRQDNGKYFSDCKLKEVAAVGKDDAVAKRLWQVSLEACGSTRL